MAKTARGKATFSLSLLTLFWALSLHFAPGQSFSANPPVQPNAPVQPLPPELINVHIPPDALQRFAGQGPSNTRPFTIEKPMWEIHWRSTGAMTITMAHLDGKADEIVAQQTAPAQGSTFETAPGTYYLKVTGADSWDVWLTQFRDTSPSQATPTVPTAADLPVDRTYYQNPIVMVRGDSSVGTGFLVKINGSTCVITNQHVISDNLNLVFQTIKGVHLKPASLQLASDRDLAMIKIDDSAALSTLPFSTDVASGAHNDDETVIPGNSQGGDVVVDTPGKIVGIGPVRVVVSNPIYPGNSGSPVVDLKTKEAVGVITEAERSDNKSWLDQSSMANQNSAIKEVRYYSLRFDNVPKWEPANFPNFYAQTHFLESFHENSMEIASFMAALHTIATNQPTPAPQYNQYGYREQNPQSPQSPAPEQTAEEIEFKQQYKKNSKLVDMLGKIQDAISSQQDVQFQAQDLTLNLTAMVKQDMSTLRNSAVFSSFNFTRAQDELQLRNELLSGCQKLSEGLLRD